MTPRTVPRVALTAGVATGVGSLPHRDVDAAVEVACAIPTRLPFAPQLPSRTPLEGMIAQWLGALPEVTVEPDGTVTVSGAVPSDPHEGIAPVFDADAHGGLLAFVDRLEAQRDAVSRVKVQITGPVTLGVALVEAGVPAEAAFARAGAVAVAWGEAVVDLFARRLDVTDPVVFLDEPSLVAWSGVDPPLPREAAVDLLSSVLAGIPTTTGVHVCGDGDRRMALEAGPDIAGFPLRPSVLEDGVALSRFLDAGGWIAWGAVPTDRPVGEQADHWWNELVSLWCELTRGGCDPVLLRTQAMITPACGLAGHAEAQAERILRHCVEIGERVREQAIATRLSIGA